MPSYCSTEEEAILIELRAAAGGSNPGQAYAAAFFAAMPRMLETFSPERSAALAERFASNDSRFTPTLIIGQNAARAGEPEQFADPRLRHLPPEVVAAWDPQGDTSAGEGTEVDPAIARRSLEVGADITRAMQRAGVPVLAGTYLRLPYVLPGFSLHDELRLLVEGAFTQLEALRAATRNAGHAVEPSDDLGEVEPGKPADLVPPTPILWPTSPTPPASRQSWRTAGCGTARTWKRCRKRPGPPLPRRGRR